MKAIKILSTLLLIVLVTSCNSGKEKQGESSKDLAPVVSEIPVPEATPVDFKELSGYFLNNSYELPGELNIIEAANKDQMKLAFGTAKTMKNKIDTVDFNTSAVIGVALQPTDIKTDMKIEKVEKLEETLNVYLTLDKGEKQSFTIKPVVLFSISKQVDVKNVQLYIEGVNKEILPLKFKNL